MKKAIILFVVLIGFYSCKTHYEIFLSDVPPPEIAFSSNVELFIVGPPPLKISENNFKTKSKISSQYFRIAVLPCIDMTGNSDNLKNSLADIFYTALFETKRFSLLDRGEIKKMEEITILDIVKSSSVKDTLNSNYDARIIDQMTLSKQTYDKAMIELLDRLQCMSDGILQIYITSDKKSTDGTISKVGIDYRIVGTYCQRNQNEKKDPKVLFAGSKDISYSFDKNTSSLTFNREDINDVAELIRNKFPNPDLQEELKVINKRGTIISVNAGKNHNIIEGMRGYVIRIDQNLDQNALISYRAEFQVIQVFADTFNAELLIVDEEDNTIVKSIDINEPVRMK
jgi:hypothetical protein